MDPKKAAREYLLAAERYIKDSLFDDAQREVKKAQEMDPSNVYTFAFLERIEFFRQQRATETGEEVHASRVNGTGDAASSEDDANHSQDDTDANAPDESVRAEEPAASAINGTPPDDTDTIRSDNIIADTKTTPEPGIGGPHETTQAESDTDTTNIHNGDLDTGIDMTEKINALEERISALNELVDGTSGQIDVSAISDKFDLLEEQINSLLIIIQEQFSGDRGTADNSEKIEAMDDQIRHLSTTIAALEESTAGQKEQPEQSAEKLEQLEAHLDRLQQSLEARTSGDADEMKSKLDDIERRLNELSDDLRDEKSATDFDRIETQLGQLQERVEHLAASLTADDKITKQYEEVSSKYAEMEQRLGGIEESAGQTTAAASHEVYQLQERLSRFESALADLQNKPGVQPEEIKNIDARLEEVGEAGRHLQTNYADLEHKLQEFISQYESRQVSRQELSALSHAVENVRARVEDVAGSSAEGGNIQQSYAELLSLYKELEQRIKHLDDGIEDVRKDIGSNRESPVGAQLETRIADLNRRLELMESSHGDTDDLSARIEQTETILEKILNEMDNDKGARKKAAELGNAIDTLYQQVEEILETLHFEKELREKQRSLESSVIEIARRIDRLSSVNEDILNQRVENSTLEKKLQALQERLESEQQRYQSLISKMSDTVAGLESRFEAEHHEREQTKQRQVDFGRKHFRTAAMKVWERGAPAGEDAAELRNLADTLAIPEPIEREIVSEVKMEMYSRAVKKLIADRKTSNANAPSLDTLRRRYDVSLEEYIEYESKFLDSLVSTQFQGTVLLVTADDAVRTDLGDRLKSVGFAVVACSSPETALEKLDIVHPNVIMSDVRYPGSHNGTNLLNVLRRNVKYSYIPFIMMGYPDELDAITGTLDRPNECIVNKPLDFDTVLGAINKQLRRLRDHLSSQTL
jgi:archaellum component FlaC/ActR/RegA family two-component response regulator